MRWGSVEFSNRESRSRSSVTAVSVAAATLRLIIFFMLPPPPLPPLLLPPCPTATSNHSRFVLVTCQHQHRLFAIVFLQLHTLLKHCPQNLSCCNCTIEGDNGKDPAPRGSYSTSRYNGKDSIPPTFPPATSHAAQTQATSAVSIDHVHQHLHTERR